MELKELVYAVQDWASNLRRWMKAKAEEKLMRRVGLRLLNLTMFNALMRFKENVAEYFYECRKERLMKRTWARMTMARLTQAAPWACDLKTSKFSCIKSKTLICVSLRPCARS